MRIIKHGEQEKEIGCGNCGSQIGYRSSDEIVKTKRHELIVAEARYIICPACENQIITQQYGEDGELDAEMEEIKLYLEAIAQEDPGTGPECTTTEEEDSGIVFPIFVAVIVLAFTIFLMYR